MFCFNLTAMDSKKEWSNAQVLTNGSLESVNECTSKEVVSMTQPLVNQIAKGTNLSLYQGSPSNYEVSFI